MANSNATPEHWAQIEMWSGMGSVRDRCLYSLMCRVRALEAAVVPLELTREEKRHVRELLTPSLKEEALEAARIELVKGGKNAAIIIRALEALPDD